MSMRDQDFATVAARLRLAAERFERWAPLVDAVATERPVHVPPVSVKGVARPVEALAMAREDQGIAVQVDAVRRSAIQAVLHAERATALSCLAEKAYAGTPSAGRSNRVKGA